MEYKIPNKNEVDLFVPEYKTSHNGEKEKNLQNDIYYKYHFKKIQKTYFLWVTHMCKRLEKQRLEGLVSGFVVGRVLDYLHVALLSN